MSLASFLFNFENMLRWQNIWIHIRTKKYGRFRAIIWPFEIVIRTFSKWVDIQMGVYYDINTVILRCLFSCLSRVLWTYFSFWPIRTHLIVLERSYYLLFFQVTRIIFIFRRLKSSILCSISDSRDQTLSLSNSTSNSFVIILTFMYPKTLFL